MNRLKDEPSPYLWQHQDNPVDWWPWCDEAFEEAKARDVPVFLSIGYATCHWCHVMAHESFEDEEVGRLMNEAFVSVKVDREARPDIDAQYMAVCQLIGRHCGWPLTVLLTPDRLPFYVATYLPKHGRFGRMGMTDLIPRVTSLWTQERDKVEASALEIVGMLRRTSGAAGEDSEAPESGAAPAAAAARSMVPGSSTTATAGRVDDAWFHRAYGQLAASYDPVHGGFGGAPKFPSPQNLTFMLRYGVVFDQPKAIEMARETIVRMGAGGVFDQVGGGFHRYSTDSEWRLPHFEKMLHDQALMLLACVEGWLATKDETLRDIGLSIAQYVIRDMQRPGGGFYAAEDADSDGEEGTFYVWSEKELRSVLGADFEDAKRWFGTSKGGNFEDEATRERNGLNVLHPGTDGVRPSNDQARAIVARLFEHREGRNRPLRDEKVLTDWNGLMITAMARAATAWSDDELGSAAIQAAEFILTELKDDSGGLLHTWIKGSSSTPAFLDDYAFFADGLLALYEWSHDPRWLEEAAELARDVQLCCDAPGGGFYFDSSRGEKLLMRQQQWRDGAMPSGNAVALSVLLKLGHLSGTPEWYERAAAVIDAARSLVDTAPGAMAGFLSGLFHARESATQLVLVEGEGYAELLDVARYSLFPETVTLFKEEGVAERLAGFAAYSESYGNAPNNKRGQAAAFVCRNNVCEQPVESPADLKALLNA